MLVIYDTNKVGTIAFTLLILPIVEPLIIYLSFSYLLLQNFIGFIFCYNNIMRFILRGQLHASSKALYNRIDSFFCRVGIYSLM